MPELVIGDGGEIRSYGVFVRPASKEERAELLDFLETEGFTYDPKTDREDVFESRFPVSLNLEEKWVSRMWNVTTAACAATQNLLRTVEEFHELYAELQSIRS